METMAKNDRTLFLDRDGVINRHPEHHYVRTWDEFYFCPGTLEALTFLSKYFSHIIVITNQQGIGKGLMTEEDLASIHDNMRKSITVMGGRIDAIFHCPDLRTMEENCRKPSSEMALRAKSRFPGIVFEDSIMVGDQMTDIAFGRQLGMTTVLVENDHVSIPADKATMVDYRYKDLKDFADHYLTRHHVQD